MTDLYSQLRDAEDRWLEPPDEPAWIKCPYCEGRGFQGPSCTSCRHIGCEHEVLCVVCETTGLIRA
jgi:hypothetical protein